MDFSVSTNSESTYFYFIIMLFTLFVPIVLCCMRFKKLKSLKSKEEYLKIQAIPKEVKLVTLGVLALIWFACVTSLDFFTLLKYTIYAMPVLLIFYLDFYCRENHYFFKDVFFIKGISYSYKAIKAIEYEEKGNDIFCTIFYDSRSLDRGDNGKINFFIKGEEWIKLNEIFSRNR